MAIGQTTTSESAKDRAEHPGTWLRLPCCDHAVHPVRIQSQSDGVIVITAPREPHATWVRRPDDTTSVTLGWTDAGGTLVLECRVLPVNENGDWPLEVVGMGDFVQRRRHLRVTTDAPAQLMDKERDEVITAKLIDLSESGFKCAFVDYVPAVLSGPMRFTLRLESAVIVVFAEMRWSGRVNPVEVHAGFEFVELHESNQTRIRQHVLHQLDTRGNSSLV